MSDKNENIFGYKIVPLENNTLLLPSGEEYIYSKAYAYENLSAEFDYSDRSADMYDYIFATASGVLTALISQLIPDSFSLADAYKSGEEEIKNIIIKFAAYFGYKGQDFGESVKYLDGIFKNAEDKLKCDYVKPEPGHLALWDLVSSLIMQFTGVTFRIDEKSGFEYKRSKEYNPEEKSLDKKIFDALMNWVFSLIDHTAVQDRTPDYKTGVPAILMTIVQEISKLPLFAGGENISNVIETISEIFHNLISEESIKNAFIEDLDKLSTEEILVILNESIVKVFYCVRSLKYQLELKEIKTLEELKKVDFKKIVSFDSRPFKRMVTVSLGVFLAFDSVGKIAKSLYLDDNILLVAITLKGRNKPAKVRLKYAIKSEFEYITEDFEKVIENLRIKERIEIVEETDLEVYAQKEFAIPSYNTILIHKAIEYDILHTKDAQKAISKQKWLAGYDKLLGYENFAQWRVYEENIYQLMCRIHPWEDKGMYSVYLLALELSLFRPYFKLNKEDEKQEKLIYRGKYIENVFCKNQNSVTLNDIEKLNKLYKESYSYLTGKTYKAVTGIAAVAVATVATGGLRYRFAPQIAVTLAGGAFAGLHGAALTNASLAAFGGGALAAGGFGMVGGTAVIGAGGALTGGLFSALAKTGAEKISDEMAEATVKETADRYAKALAIAQYVYERFKDKEYVVKMKKWIEQETAVAENYFTSKLQLNKKDYKKQIKAYEKVMDYLGKANKKLSEYIENK